MEKLVGLTHFFLPEILCSLPLQLHPDYDVVEESTNAFLFQAAHCSSDAERELLRQWKMPLFTCLANPGAVVNKLVAATQLLSLGFVIDDDVDEQGDHKARDGAKAIDADAMLAVVDGQSRPSEVAPSGSDKMLAFKAVWDMIIVGMPRSLRQRFVKNMKDYLRAVASYNNLIKRKQYPTVASFISSRRLTVAAYVMFNLAEYSLEVDIDECVFGKEKMIALHSAAADHIAWVNDLLSFRKEYFQGQFHNLPSNICINDGCTFQDAVDTVCRMIHEREQDYDRLAAEIAASDEIQHQPGLSSYLKAVGSWMSANLEWSYQSARYHGVNTSLIAHRSGVIHLSPERTDLSLRQIEE